jgi:hypothetical protein
MEPFVEPSDPEAAPYGAVFGVFRTQMEAMHPRLVIFTFKKTAEVLFGPIVGNGLIRNRDHAGAPIFVMPGPYAPGGEVERRLRELRDLVDDPPSE